MTPEDLRTIYKVVLNNQDGEKIISDLEVRFHIHGSTFSADPNETAYREGQRTVVLFLKSMLREQKEPNLNE
jgi:hypothetical protein